MTLRERASAFVEAVIMAAEQHGVVLSHEDHEGNFKILDRSTAPTARDFDAWLRAAEVEDTQ